MIDYNFLIFSPLVDFSKYSFVNVVTASTTKIGFEGVLGGGGDGLFTADGVRFYAGTFGPIREYVDDLVNVVSIDTEVKDMYFAADILVHNFYMAK